MHTGSSSRTPGSRGSWPRCRWSGRSSRMSTALRSRRWMARALRWSTAGRRSPRMLEPRCCSKPQQVPKLLGPRSSHRSPAPPATRSSYRAARPRLRRRDRDRSRPPLHRDRSSALRSTHRRSRLRGRR